MTAEQIAELRKLSDDAQQEPSSPFVNELGGALEKTLDEREALLTAVRKIATEGDAGLGLWARNIAVDAVKKAET